MSKIYIDVNTRLKYDKIPEGKVLPLIVNNLPVTEKAHDKYYDNNPYVLPEVVISNAPKSTTMAAYYDRAADASPNNYIRHSMQLLEDLRIHKANYWEGITNMLSPSSYVGAAFDVLQGDGPFWERVWYGNSGYVSDKFSRENPRLTALINSLGDIGLTYGIGKTYRWGTTPRVKYGTETPIVEYTNFSPRVTKYTQITPSEMHVRNNTPGFIKSTYKGIDPNGLYVYTLPKIWFPKNPKIAFNKVISKALNLGYEKITHPNLLGIALMNKKLNRVVSDFGDFGRGQVGWTWKGVGFGDAAFETVPEFKLAMLKKGGKLKIK